MLTTAVLCLSYAKCLLQWWVPTIAVGSESIVASGPQSPQVHVCRKDWVLAHDGSLTTNTWALHINVALDCLAQTSQWAWPHMGNVGELPTPHAGSPWWWLQQVVLYPWHMFIIIMLCWRMTTVCVVSGCCVDICVDTCVTIIMCVMSCRNIVMTSISLAPPQAQPMMPSQPLLHQGQRFPHPWTRRRGRLLLFPHHATPHLYWKAGRGG